MNCGLQGVLLAADQTVSTAADSDNCQNGVDVTVCHNGTANHNDDVEPSSNVSRVRLVQFEKNTTDPLVCQLVSFCVCLEMRLGNV